MLNSKLIRIHARHPAKEDGEDEGNDQNQNLPDDLEAWAFRSFVFLDNGGNGNRNANQEEANPDYGCGGRVKPKTKDNRENEQDRNKAHIFLNHRELTPNKPSRYKFWRHMEVPG